MQKEGLLAKNKINEDFIKEFAENEVKKKTIVLSNHASPLTKKKESGYQIKLIKEDEIIPPKRKTKNNNNHSFDNMREDLFECENFFSKFIKFKILSIFFKKIYKNFIINNRQ